MMIPSPMDIAVIVALSVLKWTKITQDAANAKRDFHQIRCFCGQKDVASLVCFLKVSGPSLSEHCCDSKFAVFQYALVFFTLFLHLSSVDDENYRQKIYK